MGKELISELSTGCTKVFIGLILLLCIVVIMTLPFMWLWNWVMPAVFGLATINFWQSLGILILSNILFKINYSTSK